MRPKPVRVTVEIPFHLAMGVRKYANSTRRTMSNATLYLIERGLEAATRPPDDDADSDSPAVVQP